MTLNPKKRKGSSPELSIDLKKEMKYFDAFSGYGGFELGAIQAIGEENIEVCGFSEIDKYAIQVYKKHFPKHKNYGDISKINWDKVPDFDLLTGGSPCQDLSIAGKRQGLNGERSGLFYEYMRAVREKKPKYFIWENVKGTLSSQKGWDFGEILNEMAEAGYSLWWQVLNAKDFGVPQNRERIFVVGFRDQSAPEIFFEREADGTHNENNKNKVARCIDANYGKGWLDNGQRTMIQQLNNPTHSNNRLYSDEGISPALNTAQGGNRQPKIITSTITTENAHGFGKNVTAKQAFDIASLTGHLRRLTPLEAERLMGLPDDWLKYGINEKGEQVEISDTQRYKLAGNGLVPQIVAEIVKKLIVEMSKKF